MKLYSFLSLLSSEIVKTGHFTLVLIFDICPQSRSSHLV